MSMRGSDVWMFRQALSMSGVMEHRLSSRHVNFRGSYRIQYQVNQKDDVFTYPSPMSTPYGVGDFHKILTPPPPPTSSGNRISPAVLIIIVILAILFFISGVLHLLVRVLTKHPSSSASSPSRYPDISGSDAIQRQLQQLFHLHDAGLDQAFIDTLPVFMYKEIKGLKEPFDCAVCLCEFSENDNLRLLPLCSHAFHINCINTWLLSNSTCPICRGILFSPGYPIENPMFDYDDPREEDSFPTNGEDVLSSSQKPIEIGETAGEQGVFPVRLGKLKRLNGAADAGGETSSSNLGARRCYSMGSYQYVVGDANLMVATRHGKNSHDGCNVGGTEQKCYSFADGEVEGKKIGIGSKTDSYSVSKIWLWSKKGHSSETRPNNPSLNIDFP